ncbi:MAG: helix-turn-helix domain-containing protein [Acetatifactor sp.]|nr:helix-turn-helix domain-containing protein [Acetatifactor sp.]
MLDSPKIGNLIAAKRKNLGLTQQQLADKLNISFQAISKWENRVSHS